MATGTLTSVLMSLLLLQATPLAHPVRHVAVAPAAGPAGRAALGMLRELCSMADYADTNVLAICGSESEEAACKRAACGTLCCEGTLRDLCAARFPSLRTSSALGDSLAQPQECRRQLTAALASVDTLVIFADTVHPTLSEVEGSFDQVISVPPRWAPETILSHTSSLHLMDAAVAAKVQHIVLHSSLGATGQRCRQLINTARMGGVEHQALRRTLEEHLEECSLQHGTRHTILQAAPYASLAQLEAQRLERERAGGSPIAALPPLTSPETLASASISAAFGLPHGLDVRATKLRANYRRVTREVISLPR